MSEEELQTATAEDEPVEELVLPWPSPGQKLKKLREELGLSHGRIADALHMTAHYVKALEDDEYDKLPGKTFVKGYFRAYAKLLGANVDDLMACYEKYVSALEESVESEASVIRAKQAYDQNMRWMICAALIIVVVVGVSWWLASRQDTVADMADSRSNNVAEVSTAVEETVTAEELIAALDEGRQDMVVEAEDETDFGTELDTETEAEVVASMAIGQSVVMQEDVSAEQLLTKEGVDESINNTTDTAEVAEAQGQESRQLALVSQDLPVEVNEESMERLESTDSEGASGLDEGPVFTVTEQDSHRTVQLESEGNDLLQIHFSGASWVEVDNNENTRLYNDMLDSGDDLTIRGQAPFNILIGNANVVDMTFNSEIVDVTQRIRTDNSARLVLEPETR